MTITINTSTHSIATTIPTAVPTLLSLDFVLALAFGTEVITGTVAVLKVVVEILLLSVTKNQNSN